MTATHLLIISGVIGVLIGWMFERWLIKTGRVPTINSSTTEMKDGPPRGVPPCPPKSVTCTSSVAEIVTTEQSIDSDTKDAIQRYFRTGNDSNLDRDNKGYSCGTYTGDIQITDWSKANPPIPESLNVKEFEKEFEKERNDSNLDRDNKGYLCGTYTGDIQITDWSKANPPIPESLNVKEFEKERNELKNPRTPMRRVLELMYLERGRRNEKPPGETG